MSGTLQSAGSRRVIADYVVGIGDGKHVLEYQGEFFYETGEILKDKAVAEKMPEPFKTQALAFIENQGKPKPAE